MKLYRRKLALLESEARVPGDLLYTPASLKAALLTEKIIAYEMRVHAYLLTSAKEIITLGKNDNT